MSSIRRHEWLRSVQFRLTLHFALLFSVLAATVFVVFHGYLQRQFRQRLDQEARSDAAEYGALFQQAGASGVAEEISMDVKEDGATKMAVALLAEDGAIVAQSDLTAWPGLVPAARSLSAERPGEATATVQPDGSHHAQRLLVYPLADGTRVVIGRSMRDIDETLESYRHVFYTWIAVMVVLGSLLAWGVARRAMQGVQRVTATAVAIDGGELRRRVPVGTEGAEIEHLAEAFNGMLARIETLVMELRQVTHDVAHDLRSPLTRMRGISEMALGEGATEEQRREACATVVEECDRLVGMINTMLEIAEANAMLSAPERQPIDLGELAGKAHELFQPVAEDNGLRFEFEAGEGDLRVGGDLSRLQRAVANVVDNAIKFTPSGGCVSMSVQAGEDWVELSVRDTGIGVEAADLPHVFERFYRADRSRTSPGNGLGLSLAHAIVTAHGGEVAFESEAGKGSTVRLRLPRFIGKWQEITPD